MSPDQQKVANITFNHNEWAACTQRYMRSIINLYNSEWNEILAKAYEMSKSPNWSDGDNYDEDDDDERANLF